FVSRVDEHPTLIGLSIEGLHRHDFPLLTSNPRLAVAPLLTKHRNVVFSHELFEGLLCNVRLDDPHRPQFAVHGGGSLPLVAVTLATMPLPRLGLLIVLPDLVVELASQSANDGFIACVGPSQTTAGQT